MKDKFKKILFTEKEIQEKIKELAYNITQDYRDYTEVIFVGVLKGAVLFMTDLIKQIPLSNIILDFMVVSSYKGGTSSSGEVRILKDLDFSIKGKHILLIEDIVDNGLTLSYLLNYLNTRSPASVRVCVLLDKVSHRKIPVPIDYCGFICPDEFVVGYGLDFEERFRNCPFIGVL